MANRRKATAENDPLSPDHFRWEVAVRGYSWEKQPVERFDGREPPDWPLVLSSIPGDETRSYNPLAVPELFRAFASTALTQDAIRQFANQYGLLGLPLFRLASSGGGFAERHGDLDHEILAMRVAVRLWDAWDGNRAKELRQLVMRLDEMGPAEAKSCAFRQSVSNEDWVMVGRTEDGPSLYFPTRPLRPAAPIDRWTAAWDLLIQITNERLVEHCAPLLHYRTARAGAVVPRITPKNLLGALWWQFARVITGESTYQKCKACPRRIEVSAGDHGFRTDREFCSNACRLRDHRQKVRKAKAMKAKGRTVIEIAKHFDTTSEVIKNWLTKKK